MKLWITLPSHFPFIAYSPLLGSFPCLRLYSSTACQGLRACSGGTLFTLPWNGAEGFQSAPTDLLSSVSSGFSVPCSLVVPTGPNGLEVVSDLLQITSYVKFGGWAIAGVFYILPVTPIKGCWAAHSSSANWPCYDTAPAFRKGSFFPRYLNTRSQKPTLELHLEVLKNLIISCYSLCFWTDRKGNSHSKSLTKCIIETDRFFNCTGSKPDFYAGLLSCLSEVT